MFLGHYAVALAAKRVAPRTSLGTLVFGAQFLDLLWPALLLLGVEQVRVEPGLMEANSLDFVYYPISHSLLMATVWGAIIGGVYYAVRRHVTGALIVGGAVLSHWFLDLPMHRPDLPLWPGSATKLGLGLWNSLPLTLALEIGLLALGVAIYLRTTRPRGRRRSWGLWAGIAVLVLFFLGSFAGPPPAGNALAWGGLALWLFVAWGYRVDRHRTTGLDLEGSP